MGIGIIEVKDWNLDAMHYHRVRNVQGIERLVGTRNEKTFAVADPIIQVCRYKREIYDLYCPRLAAPAGLAAISAGVIFPFAQESRLKELFAAYLPSKYDFFAGAEAISSGDVARVFPSATRISSSLMTPELADDLRSWLIEPDYAAEQRRPLELDASQLELISTRTDSGYRRIRGPAGSGKSLVLAARAARLVDEGKDVLIVTYNITLMNYIRDLCARVPKGRPNLITWLNFHNLCKRLASELDILEQYNAVWLHHFENEVDGFNEVPKIILRQIESQTLSRLRTYDAVLVDEGQDFNPVWWDLLRHLCRQGGEMILISDVTQDVYPAFPG